MLGSAIQRYGSQGCLLGKIMRVLLDCQRDSEWDYSTTWRHFGRSPGFFRTCSSSGSHTGHRAVKLLWQTIKRKMSDDLRPTILNQSATAQTFSSENVVHCIITIAPMLQLVNCGVRCTVADFQAQCDRLCFIYDLHVCSLISLAT